MTPTLAFFSNKGGVGKTTLVFHLAHSWADLGKRILLLDLDPQSNLTSMCLSEERLEEIWPDSTNHRLSILGSIKPIMRGTGDLRAPHVEAITDGISLVPGDLGLSSFEDKLSAAWSDAMDSDESAFRTLSVFHRIARSAEEKLDGVDLILMDLGPNLGAINRAALLAASLVITPLAPDLFSVQDLRNLGPTLASWRASWRDRLKRSPDPALSLPPGDMRPLGYIVMQAGMRLSRPLRSRERWITRIPEVYAKNLSNKDVSPASVSEDPACLAILRHYQSLMPLAQDAQKPMFHLKPADGAIGSHMEAVFRCQEDFRALARTITSRIKEV